MPSELARVDYTKKDFESLFEMAAEKAAIISPEMTDAKDSDPGMTIISIVCGIADMLAYYIDKKAADSFMETAILKSNVVRHATLIDYRPSLPSSSSADVIIKFEGQILEDVVIPQGFRLSARGGDLVFEVATEKTIYRVSDYNVGEDKTIVTVTAIEGEEVTDQFFSTGKNLQSFELSYTPQAQIDSEGILQRGIVVTIDGEEWTYIDNLYYQYGKYWTFDFDYIGDVEIVKILFGDNKGSGSVPPTGSEILVDYRNGNGDDGNVVSSSIDGALDTIIYSDGSPISVASVDNALASTGGNDMESTEEIRINAPRALRALYRAVTEEDYNHFASTFSDSTYGSIAAASTVLFNNDYTGNDVRVYVLARDTNGALAVASSGLKQALYDFLENRKIATNLVSILDGTVVALGFEISVNYTIGTSASNTEEMIKTVLETMLLAKSMGDNLYISEIYDTVADVEGVNWLVLDYLRIDTVQSPADNYVNDVKQSILEYDGDNTTITEV